ncbi:MAG: protein kinase [Deltaproteobacteria bacterium]|nr:protein kinase [Deltaproteobacteria bacterium]
MLKPPVESAADLRGAASSSIDGREALEPGTLVGRYRVERLLGEGGMGRVYAARDVDLGRRVALKTIRPDRVAGEGSVERFLREARTTARFNHPNIITVHDTGTHAGAPWIALEYLPGQSFRSRLSAGPLGVVEAARVGATIADALAVAHAASVLHRDLKPENVIIPEDGRLRVLDFGLARTLDDERAPTSFSEPPEVDQVVVRSGQTTEVPLSPGVMPQGTALAGTPNYMSPEQYASDPQPASDVWALGVMLFEMVAGVRPYAEYEELGLFPLGHAISDPDESAPTLEGKPDAFVSIVARCLAKDPRARPLAEDVARELRRFGQPSRPRGPQDPFRGLSAFREEHASSFFGREREIALLVERLRGEALVAMVGPSGAGKSSLLYGGVVPRLREGRPYTVLSMRPTREPLRALARRLVRAQTTYSQSGRLSSGVVREGVDDIAAGLRDAPGRLALHLQDLAAKTRSNVLLAVDQLEEIGTLVPDPDERVAFLDALASAGDDPEGSVRVVVTLREDFLGRLGESFKARRALEHLVVLRAPDAGALREILLESVAGAEYAFEDDELVHEIVAAVDGKSVALPLIQFAGSLLWERRDEESRTLTWAAYRAIGGVEGAMTTHADQVVAALDAEARMEVRRIVLRLVGPEGAREPCLRSDLESLGTDRAGSALLIDQLLAARLLSTREADGGGGAMVELAHESLVLHWGQLQRWLSEDVESQTMQHSLRRAVEEWDQRSRSPDLLWRGDVLADLMRWIDRSQPSFTSVELIFVEASRRASQRRRTSQRLALIIAAVVLALVSVWSTVQWQRAEGARALAEEAEQRAVASAETSRVQTMLAAAEAWRGKNRVDLAVQLAREAWLVAPDLARDTLYTSVYGQDEIAVGVGHTAPVLGVIWSQDGGTVLTRGSDATARLWDAGGRSLAVFPVEAAEASAAAFSPDGTVVAIGDSDGAIRLFSAEGALRVQIDAHEGSVSSLAFSDDGARLLSGSWDGVVGMYDLEGATLARVPFADASRPGVFAVGALPSGWVTVHNNGTVRFWDPGLLLERGGVAAPPEWGQVRACALSPDRTQLALANFSSVHLIGRGEAAPTKVFEQAEGASLRWLDWRADGRALLVQGENTSSTTVVRLDEDDVTLRAGIYASYAVWSADGRWIFQGGEYDDIVVIGTLPDGPEAKAGLGGARAFSGPGGGIRALAARPGGGAIAVAGDDGRLFLYPDGDYGHRASHVHRADLLSIVGDDKGYVTQGGNSVGLWSPRFALLKLIADDRLAVGSKIRLSPKGRNVTLVGKRGVVILDREGFLLRSFLDDGALDGVFAWSPDGESLAAVDKDDGRIMVWDRAADSVRPLGDAVFLSALALQWSPDGQRLAAVGSNGVVWLWSRDGEVLGTSTHDSGDRAVRFDPTGELLATAGGEPFARLWDARTLEPRGRTAPHGDEITHLLWSPEGDVLFTSSMDTVVRVSGRDGTKLAEHTAHTGRVMDAEFHPTGRRVATVGRDRTLVMWDWEEGLRTSVSLTEGTNSLTWSPDGTKVVAGEGTVLVVVEATDEAVIERAEQLVPTRPTAEHLEELLHMR